LDFKFWTQHLAMLLFITCMLISFVLLTFLGHWLPQLCSACFLSSFDDVQSLHCIYSWLRPQWHCTRSIWLHGGQSPWWQGLRQLCVQPSGRGLVQPDSHCSQLSPAYKITNTSSSNDTMSPHELLTALYAIKAAEDNKKKTQWNRQDGALAGSAEYNKILFQTP